MDIGYPPRTLADAAQFIGQLIRFCATLEVGQLGIGLGELGLHDHSGEVATFTIVAANSGFIGSEGEIGDKGFGGKPDGQTG